MRERVFLTEVKRPNGRIEVFEISATDLQDAWRRSGQLLSHLGKIGSIRDPSWEFLMKHYATVMLIV